MNTSYICIGFQLGLINVEKGDSWYFVQVGREFFMWQDQSGVELGDRIVGEKLVRRLVFSLVFI